MISTKKQSIWIMQGYFIRFVVPQQLKLPAIWPATGLVLEPLRLILYDTRHMSEPIKTHHGHYDVSLTPSKRLTWLLEWVRWMGHVQSKAYAFFWLQNPQTNLIWIYSSLVVWGGYFIIVNSFSECFHYIYTRIMGPTYSLSTDLSASSWNGSLTMKNSCSLNKLHIAQDLQLLDINRVGTMTFYLLILTTHTGSESDECREYTFGQFFFTFLTKEAKPKFSFTYSMKDHSTILKIH